MARSFDGAADIAYTAGSYDLSAQADFVISAWVWRNDITAGGILFEYGATAAQAGFDVVAHQAAGVDMVRSYQNFAPIQEWSDTYPQPSQAAWHHHLWYIPCLGVNPPQPNQVWIDGVQQTLTAHTHSGVTLPTNNLLSVMGRRTGGVNSAWVGGRVAEWAMWSGTPIVTSRQISALASGASPIVVYPDRLIQYVPMLGDQSPEIDVHGFHGNDLTLVGTTVSNHPGVEPMTAVRYP